MAQIYIHHFASKKPIRHSTSTVKYVQLRPNLAGSRADDKHYQCILVRYGAQNSEDVPSSQEYSERYHRERLEQATDSPDLLSGFGMGLSRSLSVETNAFTTF